MFDPLESALDGSFLLPSERMTPDNISLLQRYAGDITAVEDYMVTVRTAVFNYQVGATSKIVLNPTEMQAYIARINVITVRIGGGYDPTGTIVIAPLAANILPDLLMSMRDLQLWLCRLYAAYVDSQGVLVGPLDKVAIEDVQQGGEVV